jgi:hypothetical protein
LPPLKQAKLVLVMEMRLFTTKPNYYYYLWCSTNCFKVW